MAETRSVAEPYRDARQQRDAAMLGMYVFLGSEIMLFGGLFAVAAVMRLLHPAEVVEASKALHVWIGAVNTAVLLTSSLFVALAVDCAKGGRRRGTGAWLFSAASLGAVFLAIKVYEYSLEHAEGLLPGLGAPLKVSTPVQRAFMDLYLVATGLHALHLLIGILLLLVIAIRAASGRLLLPERAIVPVTAGLYWHLVDVIWVFLYPILYLAR
ncbi:cytochrome c oxidase subunit 3 [Xaviernesmea oryzae]|uniref:Cytochrome c oxidase subunit 3 n=1 Tax=Xaviernesmea oryzae TaxID=464029 RepID=A0A1X7GPS0_9HYPH|nr:cytochrome c oxidase subunit 3 [Xaviernesmea oryzae]SMF72771.1 cytochrome c oxidase subunit 3 [Xaviernesmea oryzae]